MIKINSQIEQINGFTTDEAILELNSYNFSETVQLTTGSTMAMPITGVKHVNVNFSLYKSEVDKENGATAFTAKGFPYVFNFSLNQNETVSKESLYTKVLAHLVADGFDADLIN